MQQHASLTAPHNGHRLNNDALAAHSLSELGRTARLLRAHKHETRRHPVLQTDSKRRWTWFAEEKVDMVRLRWKRRFLGLDGRVYRKRFDEKKEAIWHEEDISTWGNDDLERLLRILRDLRSRYY